MTSTEGLIEVELDPGHPLEHPLIERESPRRTTSDLERSDLGTADFEQFDDRLDPGSVGVIDAEHFDGLERSTDLGHSGASPRLTAQSFELVEGDERIRQSSGGGQRVGHRGDGTDETARLRHGQKA